LSRKVGEINLRALAQLGLPATVSLGALVILFCLCILTLPYTLSTGPSGGSAGGSAGMPLYAAGNPAAERMPPVWAGGGAGGGVLGTDMLGRSLAVRCMAGGGVSLAVGLSAALLSVVIGTVWGAAAGYLGGAVDSVLMRIVDILYGLPYVLLVVLLAVASDAVTDEYVSRQRERAAWERTTLLVAMPGLTQPEAAALLARPAKESPAEVNQVRAEATAFLPPRRLSERARMVINLTTLLVAIGGVSWLTMARVIRGQVMSLKARPFVEAAVAVGASPARIFYKHLLPNLTGTIIVYATLAVPQAILQESFLSFLGVGVQPPLPSWGTLSSDGLPELNPYKSNWWLLLFPCLLLSITLLALNFLGEGLRRWLDPASAER